MPIYLKLTSIFVVPKVNHLPLLHVLPSPPKWTLKPSIPILSSTSHPLPSISLTSPLMSIITFFSPSPPYSGTSVDDDSYPAQPWSLENRQSPPVDTEFQLSCQRRYHEPTRLSLQPHQCTAFTCRSCNGHMSTPSSRLVKQRTKKAHQKHVVVQLKGCLTWNDLQCSSVCRTGANEGAEVPRTPSKCIMM
ncbi:hypothetical protein NA56DRAFT_334815 [Hyaloscypha hepaticicola]|uniref:Uncharacterized protein n=1 Tax=Hyaloscypha hepaticicola TaxID=2082293 RepID=A0A2J6QIH0_9HELO|nr:hypothetical protein NA56DRAFT_334815 [Hyaloscypha hepaticicola]